MISGCMDEPDRKMRPERFLTPRLCPFTELRVACSRAAARRAPGIHVESSVPIRAHLSEWSGPHHESFWTSSSCGFEASLQVDPRSSGREERPGGLGAGDGGRTEPPRGRADRLCRRDPLRPRVRCAGHSCDGRRRVALAGRPRVLAYTIRGRAGVRVVTYVSAASEPFGVVDHPKPRTTGRGRRMVPVDRAQRKATAPRDRRHAGVVQAAARRLPGFSASPFESG